MLRSVIGITKDQQRSKRYQVRIKSEAVNVEDFSDCLISAYLNLLQLFMKVRLFWRKLCLCSHSRKPTTDSRRMGSQKGSKRIGMRKGCQKDSRRTFAIRSLSVLGFRLRGNFQIKASSFFLRINQNKGKFLCRLNYKNYQVCYYIILHKAQFCKTKTDSS